MYFRRIVTLKQKRKRKEKKELLSLFYRWSEKEESNSVIHSWLHGKSLAETETDSRFYPSNWLCCKTVPVLHFY